MRLDNDIGTEEKNRGLPGSKQETIKEVLFSRKNIISLTLILIKIVVGIAKKSKADN